jgi:flagellar hook protein FlgE
MSFQQALSGLNAASQNLDVIGNNVANASTNGAKSATVDFADMYANALNGTTSATTVGEGVRVAAITQQFSQGTITATSNPNDLAINGGGFFQVNNNGTTLYTRNGQFEINASGQIVDTSGNTLMGYPATAAGVITPGAATALTLPTGGVSPQATSAMTLQANLDSASAVTLPATSPAINFSDPTTYNNATSVTAYDAKGQTVALTYYFQKSATDTWNVYATANGTSVSTSTTGSPTPITTVTFPASGSAPTSPSAPVSFNIPATTNAAGAATLPITGATLDLSTLTEYGSAFGVTNLSQNGYSAGQLTGISVNANGIVNATYSNGQSTAAGQVELATFQNPQGLRPVGGNDWVATSTSGTPITGAPGSGNLGVLQSSALEQSNVDLTSELVNMMTAQRVYQANAQTIKTQDQILQTLVTLS